MTHRQNAFLRMCSAVELGVKKYTAEWTGFAPFETAWDAFLQTHALTRSDIGLQGMRTSGTTVDKAQRRKQLTMLLERLGDTLDMLGRLTNDKNLSRDAYLSPTRLKKLKEEVLVGHASKLLMLATNHAAGLLPLGIDAAFLDGTASAKGQFAAALDNPRHARSEKQRGTVSLAEHIATLRDLFVDKLDPAAKVLSYTQPAFYSVYQTSRRIGATRGRRRALTVTILDAATRRPVPGAKSVILPRKLKKISSAKGRFYVQSLSAGKHTIAVTKEGYQKAEQVFEVDGSGGVRVVVELAA